MHKHIPSSVKEQLVVMSSHMPSSCVARITGVNVRTVQQVIALAEQTGSVTRKPLQARKPRKLNALDVNVGSTMWHTFQCAVSHIYPVPWSLYPAHSRYLSQRTPARTTQCTAHPCLDSHNFENIEVLRFYSKAGQLSTFYSGLVSHQWHARYHNLLLSVMKTKELNTRSTSLRTINLISLYSWTSQYVIKSPQGVHMHGAQLEVVLACMTIL